MMETSVAPGMLLERDRLFRALAECGYGPSARPVREGWELANGLLLRVPAWTAGVGLLAAPAGGEFLLYLRPRGGQPSYFPATLALGLEPGRYSVETRECGAAGASGVEVASAPPLVCSPPCSGLPLTLVITFLQ